MVESNLSRIARGALFNVLPNYSNPMDIRSLPKCFKSMVGPYPQFNVKNIDVSDALLTSDDDDNDEREDDGATSDEDNADNGPPVKCNLGCLIYFGIEEWMRLNVAQLDKSVSKQRLAVNSDVLLLFKKSRKSLWTILGRFNEGKVFPIALYYGNGKPKCRDSFLKDFVEEVLEIQASGVTIREEVFSLYIWAAIFDTPAKAFILNVASHNAYGGCHICTEPGEYGNRRMYFLGVDAPLRVIDLESSILFRVLDPKAVPIDVMHAVDHDVVKKTVTLKTEAKSAFSLPASKKLILSDNIEGASACFPKEFNLPPRD